MSRSIEAGPEVVAALIGGAFLTVLSFWIMRDDDSMPLPVIGVFTIGAVTGAAVQAGVRLMGVS